MKSLLNQQSSTGEPTASPQRCNKEERKGGEIRLEREKGDWQTKKDSLSHYLKNKRGFLSTASMTLSPCAFFFVYLSMPGISSDFISAHREGVALRIRTAFSSFPSPRFPHPDSANLLRREKDTGCSFFSPRGLLDKTPFFCLGYLSFLSHPCDLLLLLLPLYNVCSSFDHP